MGQKINKTGDELDRKFNNLKESYVRLLQKKKQTGEEAVKYWPYFNSFQDIFKEDCNINPEQELTLFSSLPDSSRINVDTKINLKLD